MTGIAGFEIEPGLFRMARQPVRHLVVNRNEAARLVTFDTEGTGIVTCRAILAPGAALGCVKQEPVERVDLTAVIVTGMAETAPIVGAMTRFARGPIGVGRHAVVLLPSRRMDARRHTLGVRMTDRAGYGLTDAVMTGEAGLHGRSIGTGQPGPGDLAVA